MRKLFSVFIFILCSSGLWAQGYLKTKGPDIIAPTGEKVILRGMGLGGWILQEGYGIQPI